LGCSPRYWAVATSLGHPHHHWMVRWAYASSLCALCCPWALRVVVGGSVVSMGPTRRHCAVNGSCALSMDPLSCRWAFDLVDWPTASSIRPPSRRSTRWVANGPVISSIGPPSCRFACRLVSSPAMLSMGHASCRVDLVLGFLFPHVVQHVVVRPICVVIGHVPSSSGPLCCR
jgi:hypothetical protein